MMWSLRESVRLRPAPGLHPRPTRHLTPCLVATLLILAAGASLAQDLAKPGSHAYRCANGQYSDAPCPGGRALNVADPRSAEQQRQSRDAAQRDAVMAQQLTAERQARERAAARHPAPMAGIGHSAQPPAAAASAPAKRKKNHKARPDTDHDLADASHPSARHRKTTAEKAADKARSAPGRQAQEGRMGQF